MTLTPTRKRMPGPKLLTEDWRKHAVPTDLLLLDTNVCSALMNEHGQLLRPTWRRLWSLEPNRVATSLFVDAELRFGMLNRPSRRRKEAYDALMEAVRIIAMVPQALLAERYAGIRHQLQSTGQLIGVMDMLIAAHAMALDATLVTGDKDFQRIPGLKLDNWIEPVSAIVWASECIVASPLECRPRPVPIAMPIAAPWSALAGCASVSASASVPASAPVAVVLPPARPMLAPVSALQPS